MPSTLHIDVPARLAALATLAALLEKLERSGGSTHPDQYRALVERLSAELASVPQDVALDRLLGFFPAASELYENLQYRHAGLCRTRLDASLASEMAARELLARIAR